MYYYDQWKTNNDYYCVEEIPDIMIEKLFLSFEDKYRKHYGSLKWAEYWCEKYLDKDQDAIDNLDDIGIYREEVLAWVIEFGYKLQKAFNAERELRALLEEQREQNLAESMLDC